jgi:hypothetical protein
MALSLLAERRLRERLATTGYSCGEAIALSTVLLGAIRGWWPTTALRWEAIFAYHLVLPSRCETYGSLRAGRKPLLQALEEA